MLGLDPVSKDIYRLTYVNKGDCQVRVEVIDEGGKQLLAEQIRLKKSSTKPYSLKNSKLGEYSFKVIDTEVSMSQGSNELMKCI